MFVDIGGDEGALRHHLQPLVARCVERAPDQAAADPLPLDRWRHPGMGEDDRVALQLISGDRCLAVRHQREFLF